MKGNNYLKLTIHKIKACQPDSISKFKLKLEFQRQEQFIDDLPGREIELGKVIFIPKLLFRAIFLKYMLTKIKPSPLQLLLVNYFFSLPM